MENLISLKVIPGIPFFNYSALFQKVQRQPNWNNSIGFHCKSIKTIKTQQWPIKQLGLLTIFFKLTMRTQETTFKQEQIKGTIKDSLFSSSMKSSHQNKFLYLPEYDFSIQNIRFKKLVFFKQLKATQLEPSINCVTL